MISSIIELYQCNEVLISIVRDCVFIGSLLYAIWIARNWLLNRRIQDIISNLESRKKVGKKLSSYVAKKHANNIRDIAIRIHSCNSYFSTSTENSCKYNLLVHYIENTPVQHWIDRDGIYLNDPVHFLGLSVYVNKEGIFFADEAGGDFPGFIEYTNVSLISKLPFKNIIAYDFIEPDEYEPIFYVKHSCQLPQKLFDKKLSIRKSGELDESITTVYQSNEISKYCRIIIFLKTVRNMVLRLGGKCSRWLKS